jgi:hypothetical protein
MRLTAALAVLSLSVLCLIPRTTLADTLQFNTVGGQTTDGVDVYPYYFTVDGTQSPVSLSCLNYNREITFGETWAVDVYNVLAIPTSPTTILDGFTQQQFIEDAWLFNQYAPNAGNPAETSNIQFAIWKIMDPAVSGMNGYTSGDSATLDTNALNAYNAYILNPAANSAQFANDNVFIPDQSGNNPQAWTDNIPQIFMGNDVPPSATPEPGSLILLGTGLLGLGGAVRRKLRNV